MCIISRTIYLKIIEPLINDNIQIVAQLSIINLWYQNNQQMENLYWKRVVDECFKLC